MKDKTGFGVGDYEDKRNGPFIKASDASMNAREVQKATTAHMQQTARNELFQTENFLTPAWNKERFAQAPAILQDTFSIQEDGSFVVKLPEESKVMEGHLRSLPITPGILLKKLFLYMTSTEAEDFVNCKFLGGVFPGQAITIKKDGLYSATDKKLVDISFTQEQEIPRPEERATTFYDLIDDKDAHLLQCNDFRFIDSGSKEGPTKNGTLFRGEYTFPEDFKRQESGVIPAEIMEEAAAQVGAYITGPDLNREPVLRDTTHQQINATAKVFTFKSGAMAKSGREVKPGEAIHVDGEVMVFDEKIRQAKFCYIVRNQQGQEVLNGEIVGNIMPIGMLQRSYNNSRLKG